MVGTEPKTLTSRLLSFPRRPFRGAHWRAAFSLHRGHSRPFESADQKEPPLEWSQQCRELASGHLLEVGKKDTTSSDGENHTVFVCSRQLAKRWPLQTSKKVFTRHTYTPPPGDWKMLIAPLPYPSSALKSIHTRCPVMLPKLCERQATLRPHNLPGKKQFHPLQTKKGGPR